MKWYEIMYLFFKRYDIVIATILISVFIIGGALLMFQALTHESVLYQEEIHKIAQECANTHGQMLCPPQIKCFCVNEK